MKTIPASEVLNQLHPETTVVSLRCMAGEPCREITIEELKMLVDVGHVVGLVGGRGRLRQIRLAVPPDEAFRDIGETRARTHDAMHCDSSVTVVRSGPNVSKHYKQHHLAHCHAWPRQPESKP